MLIYKHSWKEAMLNARLIQVYTERCIINYELQRLDFFNNIFFRNFKERENTSRKGGLLA